MKTSLRCFAALALGLALLFPSLRAAGPSVETRVSRLNELVTLTDDQAAKVARIFRREDLEVEAIPATDRPMRTFEIRQASRDAVRLVLTPAQQKIYDRAPQMKGGGLTLGTPDMRVAALDTKVQLTPAQKKVALEVYTEEFETLVAIPPSERMEKGMSARQAARDQIVRILTPAQQAKMDTDRSANQAKAAEDRSAIKAILLASPNVAAHFGANASVAPGSTGSSSEGADGNRSGRDEYRIKGSTRSETVTVFWERKPASTPLRVTRIETPSGAIVP
jgi:hypothetical protein